MNANAGATIRRRGLVPLTRMPLLAAALAVAGTGAQGQGSDAKLILEAMSDYVGRQKTIELAFDSDIEVITPQLEEIRFTKSGEALLSRPNTLRSLRAGNHPNVALYFGQRPASSVYYRAAFQGSNLVHVGQQLGAGGFHE